MTTRPRLKHYAASTIKGDKGEDLVHLELQKLFPASIVSSSAKIKRSADLTFKLDDLKCMIEVKYKDIMTREDIAKFIRDVLNRVGYGTINCALFISIDQKYLFEKTPKPGKKYFPDQICGIPVAYVYSLDNLQPAIEYLKTCESKVDPYKSPTQILQNAIDLFTSNPEDQKNIDLIDDLDRHAFDYIKAKLSPDVTEDDLPDLTDDETVRVRYMFLERVITKPQLLIYSMWRPPTKSMTTKKLLTFGITSKAIIEIAEKIIHPYPVATAIAEFCQENC